MILRQHKHKSKASFMKGEFQITFYGYLQYIFCVRSFCITYQIFQHNIHCSSTNLKSKQNKIYKK